MNAKDQATYARLSQLSGAAFDRAYTRDMVRDHEADIAAFRHEANDGKDATIKGFAVANSSYSRRSLEAGPPDAPQRGAPSTTAQTKKQSSYRADKSFNDFDPHWKEGGRGVDARAAPPSSPPVPKSQGCQERIFEIARSHKFIDCVVGRRIARVIEPCARCSKTRGGYSSDFISIADSDNGPATTASQ